MEKKYNPTKVEAKWQRVWEKEKLYETKDRTEKPNYYCLVMFPYPSGDLHIGHWYNFAPADVFARFQRMNGKNVLHPMGFDAFGLPAEGAAIKRKIQPAVWTKENIKRMIKQLKSMGTIYDWSRMVNTSEPEYYRFTQWLFLQLFKRGLAYKKKAMANWCSKCQSILANEQAEGGKCWRCETEVEQRPIEQWFFKITKYAEELLADLKKLDWPEKTKKMQENWIGKSEGTLIKFQITNKQSLFSHKFENHNFQTNSKFQIPNKNNFIEVFTTRPDTIYGATFLAVAPEHPLVVALLSSKFKVQSSKLTEKIRQYVEKARKKTELQRIAEIKKKTGVFTGVYVKNPLSGEKIPVYVSDFVLMSYGTGAVMGVPGHDQRDWDFAKEHQLPIVEVVKGGGIKKKAYLGEGQLVNSGKFNGQDSKMAIQNISKYIEEHKLGQRTVKYHLRDWLVSRQRYWGAPIPMIYCSKCAEKGESYLGKFQITNHNFRAVVLQCRTLARRRQTNSKSQISNLKNFENCKLKIENSSQRLVGWWPVPEEELPVLLPKIQDYTPKEGESPLSRAKDWVKTKCPNCGSEARRETDTMDTFVCSSWYYLAYAMWHKLGIKNSKLKIQNFKDENIFEKYKELIRAWLPVDMYIGGAEHTVLHLLYSRFFTKALRDAGWLGFDEPFKALRHQGIILGEDGFKMSKSRGNVVNPDDLIKKYGVDALRLYLCFMGPYDQGGPWSSKGINGVNRFLKRVWELVASHSENPPAGGDEESRGKAVKRSGSFDSLRSLRMTEEEKIVLNKTIKKVTEDLGTFNFNTAISSLMEMVNASYKFKARQPARQVVSLEFLKTLLLLLAPLAPHIAEELWQKIGHSDPEFVEGEESRGSSGKPTGSFDSPPAGGSPRMTSVHQQSWPKYDPRFVKDEEITIVVQVDGKVREKFTTPAFALETPHRLIQPRSVRDATAGKCNLQLTTKEEIIKIAEKSPKIQKYLMGRKVIRTIFVPGKLINFVTANGRK